LSIEYWDFGFWILDFGFWILDFGFLKISNQPINQSTIRKLRKMSFYD